MYQIIAIAGGGALGALARFWVSGQVYQLLGRGFPWGTLAVNVVGSFLMGLLFVLFIERMATGPELRSAVLVGFLGALTTFSTFSMETLTLLQEGYPLKAALNIGVSVVVCVFACWLGFSIGRSL